MKAAFRYPGSKWSMAEWIIAHFPPGYEKMVYLEPFCGSGAVFFNKRPGVVETINDLDSDVVNFFQVLRSKPEDLQRALALTPYSREEYSLSFLPSEDEVERARRFIVRTTQAIGAATGKKSGWTNQKRPALSGTAYRWGEITRIIEQAAERFKGGASNLVQIENMDALQLIARYNNPDVLMYIDPPYMINARKSGRIYRHEMTESQHRELLRLAINSQAKIVISGYPSKLYDTILQGWYRDCTSSQTTAGEKATEIIWMNYESCGQLSF